MRQNKGPRKAANILKGLFRDSPALRGNLNRNVAREVAQILRCLLGEVADHCALESIGRGVVTIGVDAAVLRHELQCFHTQQVLEELQEKMPQANLRKVRFVVVQPRKDSDIGNQR